MYFVNLLMWLLKLFLNAYTDTEKQKLSAFSQHRDKQLSILYSPSLACVQTCTIFIILLIKHFNEVAFLILGMSFSYFNKCVLKNSSYVYMVNHDRYCWSKIDYKKSKLQISKSDCCNETVLIYLKDIHSELTRSTWCQIHIFWSYTILLKEMAEFILDPKCANFRSQFHYTVIMINTYFFFSKMNGKH
jgi:hypothetical protein